MIIAIDAGADLLSGAERRLASSPRPFIAAGFCRALPILRARGRAARCHVDFDDDNASRMLYYFWAYRPEPTSNKLLKRLSQLLPGHSACRK